SRTPRISTLSLHDALPISVALGEPAQGHAHERLEIGRTAHVQVPAVAVEWQAIRLEPAGVRVAEPRPGIGDVDREPGRQLLDGRSEEHTSELQSRENLVCR